MEQRYELITKERGESYAREQFAHRPQLLTDFLTLQDGLLRADLVRYLLLYGLGGTYTDLDTVCLRPISQWIPKHLEAKVNLILGVEGDSLGSGLIEGFSHRVQFATWTIRAKPGHMIMDIIVNRVHRQLRELATKQNTTLDKIEASYMDVIDTTGPGVFAESVYEGLSLITGTNVTSQNLTGMTESRLIGDVLILPVTSFAAGVDHSGAGDVSDPRALVEHRFVGSWKAEHPMALPEMANPPKEIAEPPDPSEESIETPKWTRLQVTNERRRYPEKAKRPITRLGDRFNTKNGPNEQKFDADPDELSDVEVHEYFDNIAKIADKERKIEDARLRLKKQLSELKREGW